MSYNPMPLVQTHLEPETEILMVLDPLFQLRHINRFGAALLGYSVEAMLHRNWFDHFLFPEEGKRLKHLFSRLILSNPGRVERFEHAVRKSNGKLCLVRWHNTLLYQQNGDLAGTISRGVVLRGEMARQYLLMREAAAARRLALSGFIEAQEKERRLLAEVLHEQTSQVLTACKLLVEGEQKLRNSPDLDQAGRYLQQAINQLRTLTHRYNPKQLTELGLERAIGEMAAGIITGSNPHLELTFSNRKAIQSIPADLQLCLFRIVQEQLTNIAQYAAATLAWVHLQVSADVVIMEVGDNGRGFESRNLPLTSGIFSMRCRAETHKGWLVLDTRPGGGSRIVVYLPLDNL